MSFEVADVQDAAEARPGPSLFSSAWRHRRAIAIGVAVAVVGYVAFLFTLDALTRRITTSSLSFVVTFPEARQGRYPSGAPFAAEDIVAAPVLERVFEDNGMSRFGSYWDFRSAFTVIASNSDLDLLTNEFRARLGEPRLMPAERARIEEEFRRRRVPLAAEPRFSLQFKTSSRLRRIPPTLVKKLMADVLAVWAQQAEDRKGAITYEVAVLTKAILEEDRLTSNEYLVAADVLRVQIGRLIANIDRILRIPGAQLIRVGKEQVSLNEVRAGLEDTQRFAVQPLVGLIQSGGVARDRAYLQDYFAQRLSEIELERRAAQERASAIRASLEEYSAGRAGTLGAASTAGSEPAGSVSQADPGRSAAGGTFLDRLLELYTRGDDLEYRQKLVERIADQGVVVAALDRERAYYEDLSRALRASSPGAQALREYVTPVVERQLKETTARIGRSIDSVNEVFRQLSESNLNAPTLLYRTPGPVVVDASSGVGLPVKVAGGFAVAAAALMSLVVLAYLVDVVRHRRERLGQPAAATPGGVR